MKNLNYTLVRLGETILIKILQQAEARGVHLQYSKYTIPKKTGGHREIYAPSEELKTIQKLLYIGLSLHKRGGINLGLHSAGFIKRSEVRAKIVGFAHPLIEPNHFDIDPKDISLVRLDIKDAFSNITEKLVRETITENICVGSVTLPKNIIIYCRDTSGMCLKLDHFLDLCIKFLMVNGHAPIGYVTSPILFEHLMNDLDIKLAKHIKGDKNKYLRYADDLFFLISNRKLKVIPSLIKIINNHGLRVNSNKIKVLPHGSGRIMLGYVLDDCHLYGIRPTKRYRNKKRAVLHKFNSGDRTLLPVVNGLNSIKSITKPKKT